MYDVLCAGEALIDLVTTNYTDRLDGGENFAPHVGGSPANLASNLHLLGLRVGLISALGQDAFGEKIMDSFRKRNLPLELLQRVPGYNTSLILVTKSKGSPDFEFYRGADSQLQWAQFEKALDEGAKIFHTTCFALSGLPARSHLLRAGEAFAKTGTTLSIDANYASKVWPDQAGARKVLEEYLSYGALLKMSEVDYERLFRKTISVENCENQGRELLAQGARLVCFTFGGDGSVAISPGATVRLDSSKIDIVDTTGAGDSFWAGFLAAHLDGREPMDCLRVGNAVASVKLQQLGPLQDHLEWRTLV